MDTPLTWYDWIKSDEGEAQEYRQRIAAGCSNPENLDIAAHLSFNAGIRAGLAMAAERVSQLILRGA